jgi:hypothetical protein
MLFIRAKKLLDKFLKQGFSAGKKAINFNDCGRSQLMAQGKFQKAISF